MERLCAASRLHVNKGDARDHVTNMLRISEIVVIVHKRGDCLRIILEVGKVACGRIGCFGLGAELGDSEPVILVRPIGNPRGKRHAKVFAQRLGITLVKSAHLPQPFIGMTVAADANPTLAEHSVEDVIAIGRKPIGSIRNRSQRKDLRQIHQRMTSYGKGELSLSRFMPLYSGDQECRCVENRGQGADPALVAVLRPKVAEQWI